MEKLAGESGSGKKLNSRANRVESSPEVRCEGGGLTGSKKVLIYIYRSKATKRGSFASCERLRGGSGRPKTLTRLVKKRAAALGKVILLM